MSSKHLGKVTFFWQNWSFLVNCSQISYAIKFSIFQNAITLTMTRNHIFDSLKSIYGCYYWGPGGPTLFKAMYTLKIQKWP